MSDFTRHIDARYPTHDEVERILQRARQMRAKAMQNAMISTWTMLQRAVTPKKKKTRTLRHA